MAKALLVVGRNNQAITLGNFATFGSAPTSANYDAEWKAAKSARIAGTFSNLKAKVNANGTARAIVLRKNSANSLLNLQPPNAAGAFEFLGSVSFAAIDTYNLQFTGTAPAFVLYWARAIWEASSGHSTFIASAATNVTPGVTMFVAFGSGFIAGSEIFCQSRLKGSGTISKCAVLVSSPSGTPFTVRLRKNGANANANFSIPANTTGVAEDLASVDTFADNDALCWMVTGQTDAAFPTAIQMVSLVEYSAPQNDLFNLPIGTFSANASPQFMAIGGSSGATFTEADIEIDHGFDVNIGKMRLNNNANTVASSVVLTLRKNGADTPLFVTVPAGTTGEYESAGAALVTFNPTDKAAIKFTGGTSGGLNFSSVGVTEYPLAPQTLTQTLTHTNVSVIHPPTEVLWLTWDPVNKSPNALLSVQNRVMSSSGVTFMAIARAIVGKTTGKWYWELVVHIGTQTATTMGGAINAQASLAQAAYPGSSPSGASLSWSGNSVVSAYVNTWTKANAATFALVPGDTVINFALDMDAGRLWIGKAGAWLSGADPAAGTLPWITGVSGTVFPSAGAGHSFDNVRLRVSAFEFSHAVPSGFLPYNSGAAVLDTALEFEIVHENAQGYFAHDVTVGPVNLAPQIYTGAQGYFIQAITTGPVDLAPTLWTNTFGQFTHAITSTVDIAPALWANAPGYFAHAVTVGAVDIAPSLWANAPGYLTHVITSTVDVAPALWTNVQGEFTHAITTGEVTLAPQLWTNAPTYYDQVIDVGIAGTTNLIPFLWENQQGYLTHVITTGAVDIAPDHWQNDPVYYGHSAEIGEALLSPALWENQPGYFSHALVSGNDLAAEIWENQQGYFAHDITTGSVNIAPDLWVNQAFAYNQVIEVAGEEQIAPELYTNDPGYFLHVIVTGAANLSPDIWTNDPVYYTHDLEQYLPIAPVEVLLNEQVYFGHTITTGAITISPFIWVNSQIWYEDNIGGRRRLPAPREETATYGEQDSTRRPSPSPTRRP
jgi:hypothetical protein